MSLMRVITDQMGRVVVGPVRAEDQLYTGKGIAVYVAVENVGRGADFEFRCDSAGDVLFRQTLAANTVMIYLPKLTEGLEYLLTVTGENYSNVKKVFKAEKLCPMNRIRLTEHLTPRKVGLFTRILQIIGW